MTSPDPKAQQAQQPVARRIQELEREYGDHVRAINAAHPEYDKAIDGLLQYAATCLNGMKWLTREPQPPAPQAEPDWTQIRGEGYLAPQAEPPEVDHMLFADAADCLAHAAPRGQFSTVVAHLRAIAFPEGAVSVLKADAQAKATEETGTDRPAAPLSSPQAGEAAAEVERLRADLEQCQRDLQVMTELRDEARFERNRLRERLSAAHADRAASDAHAAHIRSSSTAAVPEVDYTLTVYKPRDGLWAITSSVPGLYLAGENLLTLLADVPLSVETLRRLNGHETTAAAPEPGE